MKFLLHSHFLAGHAYPMQAVAQALVARGHDVVWLTSAADDGLIAPISGRGSVSLARAAALAALDAPLVRTQASGLFAAAPSRQCSASRLAPLGRAPAARRPRHQPLARRARPGGLALGRARRKCSAYSRHLHIQASSPTLEFDQWPRPSLHRQNTVFVGPLVSRPRNAVRGGRLPSWWPDVVAHERVIGVTQGTLATDPASLIVPSVQALQHEPDVLVVVSPFAQEVGARLHGGPNVRFAAWLPYDVLLPRLSLLITNGGYGSITQALSHNVPLLCAGQTEDKRDTAARVVWSGVGIDLRTDSPSPDQVRAAARKILGDSRYQTRARKIGDELNSLGGAERACDVLEELVRSTKAPACRANLGSRLAVTHKKTKD